MSTEEFTNIKINITEANIDFNHFCIDCGDMYMACSGGVDRKGVYYRETKGSEKIYIIDFIEADK